MAGGGGLIAPPPLFSPPDTARRTNPSGFFEEAEDGAMPMLGREGGATGEAEAGAALLPMEVLTVMEVVIWLVRIFLCPDYRFLINLLLLLEGIDGPAVSIARCATPRFALVSFTRNGKVGRLNRAGSISVEKEIPSLYELELVYSMQTLALGAVLKRLVSINMKVASPSCQIKS